MIAHPGGTSSALRLDPHLSLCNGFLEEESLSLLNLCCYGLYTPRQRRSAYWTSCYFLSFLNGGEQFLSYKRMAGLAPFDVADIDGVHVSALSPLSSKLLKT